VSVTIIKDLCKAVLEQDEHRKALRDTSTGQETEHEAEPKPKTERDIKTGSKAGEAGDHQPPNTGAGPGHPNSGDSSD